MTQEEIILGNKLIAEFMKVCVPERENPPYHKSWEWLMPVCKKIASEDEVMRYKVGELISECEFEISRVFKAIVKHIKRKNG